MAPHSPDDILAWIEHYAAVDPARVYLEQVDGSVISYAGLYSEIAQMAACLAAYGVGPGDRVVAQIEKSPAGITLYLACLWIGAIFVPLNTGYTRGEIAYFTGDAEPALCVIDPLFRDNFPSGYQMATLDASGSGNLCDMAIRPLGQRVLFPGHAPAAMLYTSGTTGAPKGAVLSRAALAANAITLAEAWQFTASDILLHALPVFHVHGLFVATNSVLAVGASMLFLPGFDVESVLAFLPRASVFMGVPTFYTRLLQQPDLLAGSTRQMRLFVSGSAPLLAETHAAFEAISGHAIIERYGMTETLINTSNPYDGDRIAGTVGAALPGVSIRIADPESGTPCATGEIGTIEVKGPNLFSGYWRKPDKTAQDFRKDGYFITGDLGLIDQSGYVHIVGRGKDLIISGGLNIYPKEVESVLNRLEGVIESAVIGVPHPDFGEAVVAILVTEPGTDPALWQEVLEGQIAKFKRPKHIEVVTELPRNTMGKVQKNLLRESFAGLFST